MTEQLAWKLFAEFYDHAPVYKNRRDVDCYVAGAREAGGPVLEIGCGSGRILAPTVRAGVDITGLDGSLDMLALCRKRTRAPLVCADMRRFRLNRKFALMTIPFRPFQHLVEVEDQMSCLACIREHLLPRGRLVFDVFDPNLKALTSELNVVVPEFEFDLPDGRHVRRSFRRLEHDRVRQVQKIEIIHEVEGGETSAPQVFMRYFFRWELEHLLARCDFRVEAVYGDFDRRPVGPDTGELIFVAEKVSGAKTRRTR